MVWYVVGIVHELHVGINGFGVNGDGNEGEKEKGSHG